jgi:hypothetical protein
MEERMTLLNVAEAAELLRMEYVEMPGLALTAWQAQRLCNLSVEVSERALRTLLECGFLRRFADGRYIRTGSSPAMSDLSRLRREAS